MKQPLLPLPLLLGLVACAAACLPSRDARKEDAGGSSPAAAVAPPRMRVERGLVTGAEWNGVSREGTESRELPLWVAGSTWKVRPIVPVPAARPEERSAERGDLAPMYLVIPDEVLGGGATRLTCQYRYRDADNQVRDPDRRIEADARRARPETELEWWLGVSPLLVDFPGGPSWEHLFDCYVRGGAQPVEFQLRVQFSLPPPRVQVRYVETLWKGEELRRVFELSVPGTRPAEYVPVPVIAGGPAPSLLLLRRVVRDDWNGGGRPTSVRVPGQLPTVRLPSRGMVVGAPGSPEESRVLPDRGGWIAPGATLRLSSLWAADGPGCSPRVRRWEKRLAWSETRPEAGRPRGDGESFSVRTEHFERVVPVVEHPVSEEWLDGPGLELLVRTPGERAGTIVRLAENPSAVLPPGEAGGRCE